MVLLLHHHHSPVLFCTTKDKIRAVHPGIRRFRYSQRVDPFGHLRLPLCRSITAASATPNSAAFFQGKRCSAASRHPCGELSSHPPPMAARARNSRSLVSRLATLCSRNGAFAPPRPPRTLPRPRRRLLLLRLREHRVQQADPPSRR
jgi:hypothetical protein